MIDLDMGTGHDLAVEIRITELLQELSGKPGMQSHLLILTISQLPPSVNNLYINGRNGGRFKSDEGKAFVNTVVADMLTQYPAGKPDIPENKKLAFSMACFYPFPITTKRGKPGRDPLTECDSDNRLKACKDAIAETLGFDDKIVYQDIAIKARGIPGLLQRYPKGYCRIKLTIIGDL